MDATFEPWTEARVRIEWTKMRLAGRTWHLDFIDRQNHIIIYWNCHTDHWIYLEKPNGGNGKRAALIEALEIINVQQLRLDRWKSE